jgi:hypothetical protein
MRVKAWEDAIVLLEEIVKAMLRDAQGRLVDVGGDKFFAVISTSIEVCLI